jgi:hypothetical protein
MLPPMTVRRAWKRLGATSAVVAVLTLFGLWLVIGLTLDTQAAETIGVICLAVFVAYCVARPHSGVDVFLIAGIPGGTASMLHDWVHTPRWLGLVLVPLALLLARHEDRASPAVTEQALPYLRPGQ